MPEDLETPPLRFEHVCLRFDEAPALEDVSFQMQQGETRIILGAAGSGKTVLLKTVLGLVRPDSGHVYVFGEDVVSLSEQDLSNTRSRMGMLFQEGALFDSLTIEENVSYPLLNQPSGNIHPSEVRERVEESLRFVELEHTLEKFPSELSGGMRRRVGIARAVVTRPPLVLYDSPTAGLDPITAYTIIALIVKQRDLRNVTTAIVTHRYQDGIWLSDFRYNARSGRLDPIGNNGDVPAPRTIFMVLREGQLVFEGTRVELEASEDPYVARFVRR